MTKIDSKRQKRSFQSQQHYPPSTAMKLYSTSVCVSILLHHLLVALSNGMSTAPTSSNNNCMASSSSLGGSRLQELVVEAAQRDCSNLDLQGIVWMEHVNLITGGPRSLVERFYVDVLGCTPDAGKSFHVNLGQQQFHLAVAQENEAPQVLAGGSIGLAVPNLETLRSRIQAALQANDFEGTLFGLVSDSSDCITLRGPWGNIFHCYSIQNNHASPSSTKKMVAAHAIGGIYGSHRMAVRDQPGIRYMELPCPPGTASAVASFYRDMLQCTVHMLPQQKQIDNDDETSKEAMVAVVSVGPGVHLVFVEKSIDNFEQLQQASKGIHICVYTHNFAELYQRLYDRKLIWTNPRFTHLDSCDTWEEACASRTLRFRYITDVSNDQAIILELEHETRPLRHGQYLKVPKYEPR